MPAPTPEAVSADLEFIGLVAKASVLGRATPFARFLDADAFCALPLSSSSLSELLEFEFELELLELSSVLLALLLLAAFD